MQIAICEDDAGDLERVMEMLNAFSSQRQMTFTAKRYPSGGRLLGDAGAYASDIIFLDIYLGDMTGAEVAEKLRAADYRGALVFLTASTDHYDTGFDVDAVHYLVKPVDYERFAEAMRRALRYLGIRHIAPSIELLVDRQPVSIPVDSILYFEVYNHTVHIHTDNQVLHTSASLRDLADQLPDKLFARCHRSYVVNLSRIQHIDEEKSAAMMDNRDEVPVSRRERSALKRGFIEHMCAVPPKGG